MIEMSTVDATEVAKNFMNQKKVTLITFIEEGCPACKDLIPMLTPHEDDNWQLIIVKDGKESLTFPFIHYPISFCFIPNEKNKSPIVKFGMAPDNILADDINMQKEALITNRCFEEIVDEKMKSCAEC